jgi:hypothetical protein
VTIFNSILSIFLTLLLLPQSISLLSDGFYFSLLKIIEVQAFDFFDILIVKFLYLLRLHGSKVCVEVSKVSKRLLLRLRSGLLPVSKECLLRSSGILLEVGGK